MFNISSDLDSGILEVRVSGHLQASNYDDQLTPAVDEMLKQHSHVRVLAIIGDDFEGFDASAMIADAKLGLSHWQGFERGAIVSDKPWVRGTVRAVAPLMPCPVQIFSLAEVEDARRWLRESLGAINIEEVAGDTLHVSLLGQLSADIFSQTEGDLEAKLRGKDSFNLVLDLRQFAGWQGVSSLGAHAGLVRDFYPRLARAAIVGDKAWQRAAQSLLGAMLSADTKFFESDALDDAMLWAREG